MQKRILISLFAVILALSAWAMAQDSKTIVVGPSIIKALPANTTILLHAPNISGLVKDFKASPIYTSEEGNEIKSFISDFERNLEAARLEILTETEIDIVEMLKSARGEAVFAIGNLAEVFKDLGAALLNGEEPEFPQDLPLLIGVDAQAGRPEFKKNLLALMALAVREGAGVKTADFHGGKITTLSPPDADNDGPKHIYIGETGSKFLLSTSKTFLQGTIVKLSEENPEDSLLSDPAYKETQANLGKGGHLNLFVNMKAFLKAVDGAMEGNPFVFLWNSVRDIFFGKSLNNYSYSMTIEKEGLRSKSFTHNDGAGDGVLGWVKNKPFSPSNSPTASLVPTDVDYYVGMVFNGKALSQSMTQMIAVIQSFLSLQGQDVEIEATIEEELGFKLSTLFKSFGDEMHIFGKGLITAENPAGDGTFLFKLADDGPWQTIIRKVIEFSGGSPEQKKYMGRDIFFIPDAGTGQFAWCVTDKKLLYGNLDNIEKIIRRIGKDSPGLSAKPELKNILKNIPDQVASWSFTTLQAKKNTQELYAGLLGPLGIDRDALPIIYGVLGLSTITGTDYGYSKWNEKGRYSEAFGKFSK